MKTSTSKTSLVLMEIIITLFFFMVCGALCIQIFVSANQTNKKAVDLNKAVVLANSFGEIFKSQEGDIAKMEDYFPYALAWGEGHLTVYYDDEFNECSIDDSVYIVNGYIENDGKLANASISVVYCEDDHEIYNTQIVMATNYHR